MPSYPEIVLTQTFQQDFETGLRLLAMDALHPSMQDSIHIK